MSVPTLPGVAARTVTTPRLRTRVLFAGPEAGAPVLFLHGNLSSATWWEEAMLRLPPGFRGIAPDQRGYGAADRAAAIDATRGLGDLADDAVALLDHLGIGRAHVVGSSLGGNVVWRMLMEHPHRLLGATLVAPGSPFGFGGTKDVDGTPCWPDHAGSGAGLIHPELVRRMEAGDRGTDSPFAPRAVLRRLVWNPPFVPQREEDLLSAALSTHLGPRGYPGDSEPSAHWPGRAPGRWGPNNALSPRYAGEVRRLWDGAPRPGARRPPVLWLRGDRDLVVSDAATSDPGVLGQHGLLPGWPGPQVYPPQPMLGQIRRVLERYAAAGGRCREAVMRGCGHAPFLERPEEFCALLCSHLAAPEMP